MDVQAPLQYQEEFAKNGGSEFVDLHVSDKDESLSQPRHSSAVKLEWKNITFTLQENNRKKTLLNRLYGQANAGTMTAIMGPSGAGKTTLLNILSGHYDRGYEGEVQVNGYVREAKLFNLQSCYVMQDDCLLGYLTVRETLAMSVELRTSTRGRRKISEMVEDALELWGLQGCANTLARSLAGGERKRLVIAQELMSDVPVVFLDEPTSGLDSCSALRCVRVLRTLADNGRTVLCSLHNPSASVFSQFDRLYMLSNGMCIYNGLTEHLVPFLNSLNLHCPDFSNPSDFITDVASGVHGELTVKLSSFYVPEDCPENKEKEHGEQSLVTVYGGRLMSRKESDNERRQHEVDAKALRLFMTLMKRFWYCHIRDKFTSVARVGASLYFALLLSVTYYCSGNRTERVRDTLAMYFAILIILMYQSVTPILLTFPLEIKVLLREQRNCRYSPSLYLSARIISELPFTIGCALFIMTIVHWMTCQPMEFYRIAVVVLFAIVFCSACESISYVTSTIFSLEVIGQCNRNRKEGKIIHA